MCAPSAMAGLGRGRFRAAAASRSGAGGGASLTGRFGDLCGRRGAFGRGSPSNARSFRLRTGQRPPIAGAQAFRAACMRKAVPPQLASDGEGSAVVAGADGAAAGGNQLDLRPDTDEGAQRRLGPRLMQRHDLVMRRDGGPGRSVQSGRLRAPDPRHLVPTLVPPRLPDGTLGGAQVQVFRCRHHGLRGRHRGQSRDPVGRRRHALGQCQPATPIASPGSLLGLPVALGLEDFDCLLGEEHEPAVDAADDDTPPAARAQAPAYRRRLEEYPAIRARR